MNLFQPGPFQPILFQTGGAPPARSGVYRMLLAQAQEEANEAEKRKQVMVADAALAEEKAKKKRKLAAQLAAERERQEAEEDALDDAPPIKLRPMLRPIVIEVPEVGPVARSVADELGGWMKTFYKAATDYAAMMRRLQERLEIDVAKYKARQKRLRRAALLAAFA